MYDAGLCGCVITHIGRYPQSQHGGDIDNASRLIPFCQSPDNLLADFPDGGQISRYRRVPLGTLHFCEFTALAYTGIVYQQVNRSQRFFSQIDGASHRLAISNIHLHRENLRTGFFQDGQPVLEGDPVCVPLPLPQRPPGITLPQRTHPTRWRHRLSMPPYLRVKIVNLSLSLFSTPLLVVSSCFERTC